MSPDKNSRLSTYRTPTKPPNYALRKFGGLRVRYKLALLHNFFFFILVVSVYLSVIPLFSSHIEAARQRELKMISKIFAAELPLSLTPESRDLEGVYEYLQGSASETDLIPMAKSICAIIPPAHGSRAKTSYSVQLPQPGSTAGLCFQTSSTIRRCGRHESACSRCLEPFMYFPFS